MIRSRVAVAVLIILVVAVLAAKGVMAPKQRGKVQVAPAAARPVGSSQSIQVVKPAPPQKGAELTGADLARCLKSGKPTLADFGEGWCDQCKKMVPVLAAATEKYRGEANVVFVDTKAFYEHAQTYKVVRIPTQIFFDGKGEEVSRHIGYYPLEDIAKEMAKLGASGR